MMQQTRLALFVSFLATPALGIGCTTDGPEDADALGLDASATDAEDTDTISELAPGCQDPGTPGATAGCLTPTMSADYYADQAMRYFDELDIEADRARIPTYHPLVARWEWPPWLLLTAYGAEDMIQTASSLRSLDPSTVPVRDCRGFDVQPFARCYVEFEYERGGCPIYEEFVFNDQGEVTFIEAWSDQPGMLPNAPDDRWAADPAYPRLSTRIPGLGNETGTLDLESEWMLAAAAEDPEVADFAERAADWWVFWFDAVRNAEDDFFGVGCGWPPPTP